MGLGILADHFDGDSESLGGRHSFFKEVVWYSSLFLSINVLLLYVSFLALGNVACQRLCSRPLSLSAIQVASP